MNVISIHHGNAAASVGWLEGGKSSDSIPLAGTAGCVADGSSPHLRRVLRWAITIAFHSIRKLAARDREKRTISQEKIDAAVKEWLAEFYLIR